MIDNNAVIDFRIEICWNLSVVFILLVYSFMILLIIFIMTFSFYTHFFQTMNYPLPLEDVLQKVDILYEEKFEGRLPESFISSVQRMVIKADSSGDAAKK